MSEGAPGRAEFRAEGRAERAGVRIGPQLLTYPDSLGGDLAAIRALLDGPLAGLFSGVHVLPPFPSSADRGFAPVTYREIDPHFGTWDDISALAANHDVLLDLMVNHISRQSEEFRDFAQHGRRSRWADLFITIDKVWPDGRPPAEDVARIFLRKPDHPFSTIAIGDSGEQETIWTSFGTADWSEQVDLDLRAPATRALISDWLTFLASRGVRIVRLDAVGYVVKKAGTSCFMVEPEIWEVMDWLVGVAGGLGLTLLPEVHDVYATHEKLSAHGYWTYDFVLPGLVLDAFWSGDATRLAAHLGALARASVHDPRLPRRHPRATRPRRHPGAGRDAAPRRCGPGSRRERQSHPLHLPRRSGRRPPAQLHLLLGPR